MLQLAGVLPVSAINVGLVAAVGGLQAEVTKLTADLSELTFGLIAQAQVTLDFPPNPLSIAANITAGLNPLEIAAGLLPTNVLAGGIDASLESTIELGVVSIQISAVQQITIPLGIGLDAGGIAGWSYSGPAQGYGIELERATARGFGRFRATDQIVGVVIATESFASWGAFSQGVNTGGSGSIEATEDATLNYLGALNGGQWNTGVATLIARIRLLLDELRGIKAALQAQIQVSLGVNLPDVDVLLDAGLDVVADLGIDGLIDNLINVQTDFGAAISGIEAKIELLLDLIADLSLQLSAGGLAFWTYSGSAAGLGAELRTAIEDGVPSGSGPGASCYGLVLAGTAPSMTAFGTIFKTQ